MHFDVQNDVVHEENSEFEQSVYKKELEKPFNRVKKTQAVSNKLGELDSPMSNFQLKMPKIDRLKTVLNVQMQ